MMIILIYLFNKSFAAAAGPRVSKSLLSFCYYSTSADQLRTSLTENISVWEIFNSPQQTVSLFVP